MWLIALEHVRAIRGAPPSHVTAATAPGRGRTPSGRESARRCTEQRDSIACRSTPGPVPPPPGQPDPHGRRPAVSRPTRSSTRAPAGSATRPSCSLRVEDLRGISHLHVARSRDGVTDWRFDPEPLLAPEPRRPPGGDLGLRGPAPDLAARARGVGDRLHGLQPARAARLAGDDPRLPDGPAARPGHAARGQGRGAVPAPHRRPLGDDPPALAAARRRPHVDLVLARPAPLGRPRAAARGPRRRLVGRRQDRPRAAAARDPEGWLVCYHGAHTTASGPIYRVGPGAAGPRRPAGRAPPDRRVGLRADGAVRALAATSTRSSSRPAGSTTPATDILSLYYGAGDSVIALATARLDDLLAYMWQLAPPKRRRIHDRLSADTEPVAEIG